MNYYEIKTKSTIKEELFDVAIDAGQWYEYYYFLARPVPSQLVVKDKFFEWLATRYNFIVGVLKMEPYTCYDWHIDADRGVGINMLLTPKTRSTCLFAPKKEGLVFKIDELVYKPDTYYVFNTQKQHSVQNYETTRFLMSVQFEKDKNELSFEDLVNDIRTNYEKDFAK